MKNLRVREGETLVMKWEPPSFVELKMDAEINAYQDDFGNLPDIQKGPRTTSTAITSPARSSVHPQSS